MHDKVNLNGETKLRRWAMLITVSAGLVLIMIDNSILYTALPTLTHELGATTTQALWIVNAYPIVMVGLLLGMGTLGDRVGHRRMFLCGLVIFGLSSLLAAFSTSITMLIAARAALAVGAAAMMPATLALIAVTFADKHERAIAIGIWASLSTVGMALGPIIGGALLHAFWWGSVFLINVPIVIVTIAATLLLAPANDPNPNKHWDLLSSIWALIGLVSTVFVIKELAHIPPNWWLILIAILTAAITFTLFTRRQRRLSDPLLDFHIFRNPGLSAGVIAAALAMFAETGTQLLITQRYQLLAGYTPLESGMLLAAISVGALPASIIAGAMLQRLGMTPLIVGGLGLTVVGIVLLIVAAQVNAALILLIVGLIIIGLGTGCAMAIASYAIVTSAPAARAGMASAIEEVSYEFGSMTAIAVLGSISTYVFSNSVQLPRAVPAQARNGLADALVFADKYPQLRVAANAAYERGYLAAMLAIAVVLLIAMAATKWLLRGERRARKRAQTADTQSELVAVGEDL